MPPSASKRIVTVGFIDNAGFPQPFAFSDWDEAQQFCDHIVDLYGFEVFGPIIDMVHTYDSAIVAVVDAIGPSPE